MALVGGGHRRLLVEGRQLATLSRHALMREALLSPELPPFTSDRGGEQC